MRRSGYQISTSSGSGGIPAAHHATHEPGGSDPMAVDATATIGSLRTLGTGPGQAAAGNDPRFPGPASYWLGGWANGQTLPGNQTTTIALSAAIAASGFTLASGSVRCDIAGRYLVTANATTRDVAGSYQSMDIVHKRAGVQQRAATSLAAQTSFWAQITASGIFDLQANDTINVQLTVDSARTTDFRNNLVIVPVGGAKGDTGGSATVPMDTWHTVGALGEPAFQANWRSYSSQDAQWCDVGFRKDPLGRILLRGFVQCTAAMGAGSNMFYLPVGYRPPKRLLMDVSLNGITAARIDILATDGGVQIQFAMANGAYVALDGLVFDTDTITQMPTGPMGPTGPGAGAAIIGAPMPWLVSAIPANWREFDGSPIAQITHPQLFALFGGTIPDLRGRFLFGADAARPAGIASQSSNPANANYAAESITLTVPQMPAHAHGGATGVPTNPPSQGRFGDWTGSGAQIGWATQGVTGGGNQYVTHTHPIPSEGSGSAVPNMPPFQAVRWITIAG